MSRGPSIPPTRRKDVTAEKSREQIEIWQGNRGNKLDRVVTHRDLVKYRLGALSQNGQFQVGDVINPPATYVGPLFNLTAAGGFGIIFLDWEGTNQINYSYTEIWRSSDDNLGNAVLLATTRAGLYPDPVSDGVGYYYWVRAISTTGNPGAFNATAGTYGESTLPPEYIIDQIQGLISESELALELLTPIQAIPSIQTTLTDHDARINTIQTAVNEVLNLPVFDSANNYDVGDTVKYNGYAWRALQAMTAPSPTPVEGAFWTQIGAYQTYDDLLSANAVAIGDNSARITVNEGELTTLAQDFVGLQTSLTNTQNDVTANGSAITSLTSRVTVTENGISSNSAQITLLQDEINDPTTGLSATSAALAFLDNEVQTLEGTVSAQGQAITQLEVDVANLDVDGNAQALQELDVRVTSNEQDISSVAFSLSALQATVGDNTAAIETKAEASAVQSLDGEVTDIKAQYTIKLDVNGRVSGIGLMNDGSTSEFIVSSDAVYFIDPGQSITPFDPNTNYSSIDALRDTQFVFGYATVEGFPRFAINVPAYIPELTITNAMIKNAVITGAKIANASIGGAKINIAEIWDLSIGDLIRSNNYAADSAGWIIRRSGSAEFNEVIVRGHIEADSGYIASTLQIGGTGRDFAELVQMAENADTSLFQNWIRPNTTLIDGNKIFTGDAYVDTLQIKGQAVTFPRGAYTSATSNAIGSTWATVQSLTLSGATGAPLVIDFCCAASAQGNATMDIRLLVGGSQRFYGDDVLARYAKGFDGFGGLQYESRGLPAFTYYYASPPSGSVSVVVQIRFTGASGFVSSRSLSVMEAKR